MSWEDETPDLNWVERVVNESGRMPMQEKWHARRALRQSMGKGPEEAWKIALNLVSDMLDEVKKREQRDIDRL